MRAEQREWEKKGMLVHSAEHDFVYLDEELYLDDYIAARRR